MAIARARWNTRQIKKTPHRTLSPATHPVRDALQALLRDYPQGLTAQEIEVMSGMKNVETKCKGLVSAGYLTNMNRRGIPARYVVDCAESRPHD